MENCFLFYLYLTILATDFFHSFVQANSHYFAIIEQVQGNISLVILVVHVFHFHHHLIVHTIELPYLFNK